MASVALTRGQQPAPALSGQPRHTGWSARADGGNASAGLHRSAPQRQALTPQTSFWFRNWSEPVRPGSRLAVLLEADSGSGQEVNLAARNMDINAERWVDVRAWAQGKGLLAGKMRVWPSALLAGLIAAAFVALRTSALARQGAKTEPLIDWMLVAAIAFVPVVVVEWLFAIVAHATDTEPERIANELESYLRTG